MLHQLTAIDDVPVKSKSGSIRAKYGGLVASILTIACTIYTIAVVTESSETAKKQMSQLLLHSSHFSLN